MRSEHDTRKVLLVEDDDRIRLEVVDALQAAGFQVAVSATLKQAQEALGMQQLANVALPGVQKLDSNEHAAAAPPAKCQCDLILLDLGLPDGDGLDLCRSLRQSKNNIPIIILTARDAPEQRVRGLDVGADDYIVKPFHMPELIARIRGVLRRSGETTEPDVKRFHNLWIDSPARTAGRGDERLDLKPREFDLLLFFMSNPGRAWTRDQLIERVWGKSFDGDARTVDLHVARLRSKIEEDPADPHYVETVWGVGYRFRDE